MYQYETNHSLAVRVPYLSAAVFWNSCSFMASPKFPLTFSLPCEKIEKVPWDRIYMELDPSSSQCHTLMPTLKPVQGICLYLLLLSFKEGRPGWPKEMQQKVVNVEVRWNYWGLTSETQVTMHIGIVMDQLTLLDNLEDSNTWNSMLCCIISTWMPSKYLNHKYYLNLVTWHPGKFLPSLSLSVLGLCKWAESFQSPR